MGRFMVLTQGGSILHVCTNLKWIVLSVQKLLGSQNFEIGSRDPGHAQLGVVLYSIRRRGPSSMHLCTKFEADCSIRSNVIKGPEIRKVGHVTSATPT